MKQKMLLTGRQLIPQYVINWSCQILSLKIPFFKKLGLSTAFLDQDPAAWPLCKNYCMAVNTVNTLTVTNDHAERGVALIEEFNRALTHTEEQAQNLLQVVSEHRKKFPNCKKSTLN